MAEYTTATFLSALLQSASSTIPTVPDAHEDADEQSPNPFHHDRLPPTARNILLTLHVLFPTLFLPALDILDRRLLTRLIRRSTTSVPSITSSASLYLVRSASNLAAQHGPSSNSRFHDALATPVYEVRLAAWNCSCPAFAFAAFPPAADGGGEEESEESAMWDLNDNSLGVLLRRKARNNLPMCKHLLACVLVEHVAALKRFGEEVEVNTEEIAGWAAGWGG